MNEDIQRRIRKTISEIEEKSAGGNYIYRGEPAKHEEKPFCGKVSSSLWRQIAKELSKKGVGIEIINTKEVQKGMSSSVKNYAIETIGEREFEIMGKLQHYGGKTNLIDFTTDYLRALFFACDGSPCKDGRIILLRRNEVIDKKYQIEEPQNPVNRVIAQKSIFIQPPEGFIEPQDICCSITIPKDLKQQILQHLHKYHNVSTETIYNDLHGFIKSQRIHHGAYIDYYIGLSHQFQGREKKEEFKSAICYFNKAIEQNPNFAEAYCYRGAAYLNIKKYDCAITSLNKAIELTPDYAEAYNNRGLVYQHKHKYNCAIKDYNEAIKFDSKRADYYNNRGVTYRDNCEPARAITDLNEAIELNPDYGETYYDRGITWLQVEKWEDGKSDLTTAKTKGFEINKKFCEYYASVENFKKKYSIPLPEDIAKMLTAT